MTKKKMCPKRKYATDFEVIYKRCGPCPKNANSNCQIIPAKPKVLRVRGFVEHMPTEYNDNPTFSIEKVHPNWIPCTMLIATNILKEKRK